MPKRVGHLYEKMEDKAFIRKTILKACKGKQKRSDVRRVLSRLDEYVGKAYEMVRSERFTPSEPRRKRIYDTSSQKWRVITVVPFWPDGVMHWLLVEALKPVFMRGMYPWSCASIPGRGGARAGRYIKRALRGDRKGTKYAIEMDVKGYYPSISIDRLMGALARKVKDRRVLRLVRAVLDSCGEGLAIGYYLNQWLANFYLEPLDWYAVSLPGVKYMVRYMDNVTIFGPNKRKLRVARASIAGFMGDLGLAMKENWQIYPVAKRMVSAVGYRFARTHTILRKRNFLRLTRQCRRVRRKQRRGEPIPFSLAAGLLSRLGQLKHCDSHKARVKYIDPIGVKNLKEVVRHESKRRRDAKRLVYAGAGTE